jgi:hypothetical protein
MAPRSVARWNARLSKLQRWLVTCLSPPLVSRMNPFNYKILRLRSEHRDRFRNRVPALYREFKKGGIVCVGINPAYPKPSVAFNWWNKRASTQASIPVRTVRDFQALHESESPTQMEIDAILEIQDVFLEKYSYFNKFRDLSKKLGIHWQDLELIQLRETNQKTVLDDLRANGIFAAKSVELFIEMLEACEPRAIVIANSGAVELITGLAPKKFPKIKVRKENSETHALTEVDPIIGTHLYDDRIPLFYTSMLTQQRALDNGSYQRLVWHIGHAIRTAEMA